MQGSNSSPDDCPHMWGDCEGCPQAPDVPCGSCGSVSTVSTMWVRKYLVSRQPVAPERDPNPKPCTTKHTKLRSHKKLFRKRFSLYAAAWDQSVKAPACPKLQYQLWWTSYRSACKQCSANCSMGVASTCCLVEGMSRKKNTVGNPTSSLVAILN